MNAWILLLGLVPAQPAASFVVENVTIETGTGDRIPNAVVVVERGRIRAVGPRAKAPGSLERIDGTGKVLSPGLIESWSRLGVVEVDSVPDSNDQRLHGSDIAPAFRVADGFNPLSLWIPIVREEGVTSAVAVPSGTLLWGVGSWFETTGSADTRPRTTAMYGGVGERAATALGKSRGGVWLKLREIVADVRHYQKNRRAYDKGQSRPLALAPLHLEALIPVMEKRLPLVLVAHRMSDIRAALGFAKEHDIRLVIAGGAEAWLVGSELAAARIPVLLFPSYQAPGSFETLKARDDVAAVLAEAGVRVIISSGYWARRVRQEAGIAVAHGLDRAKAMRAITLTPAEVFGMDKGLGSVATGKRANLVLWSGDPLEVTTVAERVWIDGVEQSLDTRQRQLVRRYLERPVRP